MTFYRGPHLWVRWGEVHGWKPWVEALMVKVDGPWLIVEHAGTEGMITMVPDHIVRSRIEVRRQARQPENV